MDCIFVNNDTGAYQGFRHGDCDNSTTDRANTGYDVDGTITSITTTTGDRSGRVTAFSGFDDDGTILTGAIIPTPGNAAVPTITEALTDVLTTTAIGKVLNAINDRVLSASNIPAPNLLLNTTYCGEGGGGSKAVVVNGPCAAHNTCYERAGLTAKSNSSGRLTLEQATMAQICNRTLYDSVRMNNSAPNPKLLKCGY